MSERGDKNREIDRLISQLDSIAASTERPVWLASEYGFDECVSYCWDCAMEEIAWTRWQLRLCLWAAFDYGYSYRRGLEFLATNYPNCYSYCRQALPLGWKLAWFIWQKCEDSNWWIEGQWVWAGTEEEYYSTEFYENLPITGWLESDVTETCECCDKILDCCLTHCGVQEELRFWYNNPLTKLPSPYEARYLEILLTSIVSGVGIESCDKTKLEKLLENLKTLLRNDDETIAQKN